MYSEIRRFNTCLLFSSNIWENVKTKAELGVNKVFNEPNYN